MIRLLEYLDASGRNPFVRWREKLDDVARARVTTALLRLEEGNISNLKGVGGGLVELRIAFGPGYRVYLAWDGPALIVLFGGGTQGTAAGGYRDGARTAGGLPSARQARRLDNAPDP
ncbi:MAG: type II toxin-antitoxin system RelE/ParE family toxin [Rhizomicrobium sp.]